MGSRVLLSADVAAVDARRLAAIVLTAPRADRGTLMVAISGVLVAIVTSTHRWWVGLAVALLVLAVTGAVELRCRCADPPAEEATLARVGADAMLYAFLLQGWTLAARAARRDQAAADDLGRSWVEAARASVPETDGLHPGDVVAELRRLPAWGGRPNDPSRP